jgi:ABC transporter substrate binding protein/uncharacterized protein DUF1993
MRCVFAPHQTSKVVTPPAMPTVDDTSFAAAKSRVETALGFVKSLTRAQVDGAEDKVIAWTGGGNDRKMKGKEVSATVRLPNFFFFVTTAYNILCHRQHDRLRLRKEALVACSGDFRLWPQNGKWRPGRCKKRFVWHMTLSVPREALASLARPGSNATGFTQFEFGISAKWLELLKEMVPAITRVAVIRDPTARTGGGQLGAIQAVAPSLGVEVRPVDPHETDDIKRGLAAIGGDPNSGLIVTSSRLARVHRELIVTLAARHRLPAIYAFRVYVAAGGLSFYGPDATDPYRRAAGYVDRILHGEQPADLPVQAPVKYELAINLKTAKSLGLKVPTTLLARADEVIE